MDTDPQVKEDAPADPMGGMTEKPRQLSLGAAGLLSAAGLLPEDTAMTSSARTTSDSGLEASASDAGSSFDGSVLDTHANAEDEDDGIDPLTFLRNCGDSAGAEPAGFSLASANGPSSPAAHHECLPDGGARSGQRDAPTDADVSVGVSALANPSMNEGASAAPPTADRNDSTEEAKLMSDRAFEQLASELEGDGSHTLLNELHGLCELDYDASELHPCAPGGTDDVVDIVEAADLFPFHEQADDRSRLLTELSALPDSVPGDGNLQVESGASANRTMPVESSSSGKPPITFSGFSSQILEGGAMVTQHRLSSSKSKSKPCKNKTAAAATKPPAAAGSATAGSHPSFSERPQDILPAPRTCKFLPGAVETPAPPPTKSSLGGRPASAGSSLGRTFSWQPIKFPVYK